MQKPGIKPLAERAKELMNEYKDIDLVSSILNITTEKLAQLLWQPSKGNPHLLYPAPIIAEMYKAGNSIPDIHHKTRVGIESIIKDLRHTCGYKTFDEVNGKIKYDDLKKQAAYIADRDHLIAELYKQGWDIKGLMAEFGLTWHFIRDILKRAGFNFDEKISIPKLSGKWKAVFNDKIYNEYTTGTSIAELAKKYGKSERSISGIISYLTRLDKNL